MIENTLGCSVVIGAGYGDEGKGLMTDYLTHHYMQQGKHVLNVLHNGGPQRGHTVQDEEYRHVFRHMGAGTIAGADTLITSQFLINPIFLCEEIDELVASRKVSQICPPVIYIDSECEVTTPYDMLANQIEELGRSERHNTCGMGIWKTIVRKGRYDRGVHITMEDLYRHFCKYGVTKPQQGMKLYEKLQKIRKYYLNTDLEFGGVGGEWESIFMDEKLIYRFMLDVTKMFLSPIPVKRIYRKNFYSCIPTMYDHIIFENGQGLAIDGNLGFDEFHNTPSNTNMRNPYKTICEIQKVHPVPIQIPVEMVFVFRTYATRHGAGIFPNEVNRLDLSRHVELLDKTNAYNDWQGSLRYAKMDDEKLMVFRSRVSAEIEPHRDRLNILVSASIAVTHWDELFIEPAMLDRIFVNDHISTWYMSSGPTREDIAKSNENAVNAFALLKNPANP